MAAAPMETSSLRRSYVPSIIDKTALLERLDGDQKLLGELVQLFQEDSPQLLATIRDAVAAGDAFQLMRAAHTLKGSVGNFCAHAIFEAAFQLESIGRDGDLTKAPAALATLETLLTRFGEELSDLAHTAPAETS
jgi:HPt (histidine-containing phosphotransfer) domain-containing protein